MGNNALKPDEVEDSQQFLPYSEKSTSINSLSSVFEPPYAGTSVGNESPPQNSSIEGVLNARIQDVYASNGESRASCAEKDVVLVKCMLRDIMDNRQLRNWYKSYINAIGLFDEARLIKDAKDGQLPDALRGLMRNYALTEPEFVAALDKVHPPGWSTAKYVGGGIGVFLLILGGVAFAATLGLVLAPAVVPCAAVFAVAAGVGMTPAVVTCVTAGISVVASAAGGVTLAHARNMD